MTRTFLHEIHNVFGFQQHKNPISPNTTLETLNQTDLRENFTVYVKFTTIFRDIYGQWMLFQDK